jgi:hypothetical protein
VVPTLLTAKFSGPIQTYPRPRKILDTGLFPGGVGYSGRGVALTKHLLLSSESNTSRTILLPPLNVPTELYLYPA